MKHHRLNRLDYAQDLIRMSTANNMAAVLFFILIAISSLTPINSSGVFELELVDFKRFDLQTDSKNEDNNSNLLFNQTTPTRLHICLKEAFTSQLDGPCTFGNSTITLNSQTEQPTTQSYYQSSQQQLQEPVKQQQESPSTNLVRILFTFRWTVSKFN